MVSAGVVREDIAVLLARKNGKGMHLGGGKETMGTYSKVEPFELKGKGLAWVGSAAVALPALAVAGSTVGSEPRGDALPKRGGLTGIAAQPECESQPLLELSESCAS